MKLWLHSPTVPRPQVTPLAGVWIEIKCTIAAAIRNYVTPLAGVWIEIMFFREHVSKNSVTPLAGVWIEMSLQKSVSYRYLMSLPLRECGLKSGCAWGYVPAPGVTPLAGVWIEITWYWVRDFAFNVTPLAGVWIEMPGILRTLISGTSLPLRECGLKSLGPFVKYGKISHSPCGSVD